MEHMFHRGESPTKGIYEIYVSAHDWLVEIEEVGGYWFSGL